MTAEQRTASGAWQAAYDRSLTDPEGFWGDAAGPSLDRPPTRVLDDHRPPFDRWFPDATLNTCYNAVDRHVAAGRGDQPALIHDSPVTGTKRADVRGAARPGRARFAGLLTSLGVEQVTVS